MEINELKVYHESINLESPAVKESMLNPVEKKELENLKKETSEIVTKNPNDLVFRLKSIRGYIFGLMFAVCSCLANVLIKMSPSLNGSNHAVMRYLVQLAMMVYFIQKNNLNILGPKAQRKLLIIRGLAGCSAVMISFFSIKYLDLSDVETLTNSCVLITALLSRIFLKEKLTVCHLAALALTIFGVLFIVRPNFLFGFETDLENFFHLNLTHALAKNQTLNETLKAKIISHMNREFIESVIGVSLVLVSALCMSISQVAIRKLCLVKVHFSIISIYPALVGLPASLMVSILLVSANAAQTEFKGFNILSIHIFYSFVSGILGSVALIFLNLALKFEDATKIGMVKTMGVFFSFVLQYVLLDIEVDFLGIFGAICIVAATISIMIIKLTYESLSNSKNCFLKFLSTKL